MKRYGQSGIFTHHFIYRWLYFFCWLNNLRPRLFSHNYWVDVACYCCLIAQFCLQAFFAQTEYLGVSLRKDQKSFLVLEFLKFDFQVCVFIFDAALACAKNCICNKPLHVSKSFVLPVAVFAVAWLRSTTYFGSSMRWVGRRFGELVLGVKQRIFRDRRRLAEEREPINANSMPTVVFD